jgi:hypothetical protein
MIKYIAGFLGLLLIMSVGVAVMTLVIKTVWNW